jgi:hypothetical protein
VLLTFVLLLAGCAETGTPTADETAVMPADFAGVVEYGNGSVAPPYHYEWQVRFDDGTADVSWTPGYDDTQPWREHVTITDGQREQLYTRLRAAGVFEADGDSADAEHAMVGGPTGSVELTSAGRTYAPGALGTTEDGQRLLDEVVAAVEDLVPADVWAGLRDRQDDWSRQQPR